MGCALFYWECLLVWVGIGVFVIIFRPLNFLTNSCTAGCNYTRLYLRYHPPLLLYPSSDAGLYILSSSILIPREGPAPNIHRMPSNLVGFCLSSFVLQSKLSKVTFHVSLTGHCRFCTVLSLIVWFWSTRCLLVPPGLDTTTSEIYITRHHVAENRFFSPNSRPLTHCSLEQLPSLLQVVIGISVDQASQPPRYSDYMPPQLIASSTRALLSPVASSHHSSAPQH